MGMKEAYVDKLEAQLKGWNAGLDLLGAQAQEASGEARIAYHERMNAWKAKRDAARTKLDEVKAAGGEKWESFKTDIESAWQDLKAGFDKLKGN